jgi:asparagine synthase (glutamine-hydrolysing)
MTMGAPVECRLPFTDPRILALSAHSTARDLFRGANGKQLIRDAMVGRLPPHIVSRPKQGWQSPWNVYLRSNPVLRRWLASVPDHEIVAGSPLGRAGARTRVDAFLAGDREKGRHAWMLGRIVLWHQVCVEGVRDPFGAAVPAR